MREVIEQHFKAWNARDREGMVRDVAQDVVIQEEPGFQIAAGTYRTASGRARMSSQPFTTCVGGSASA